LFFFFFFFFFFLFFFDGGVGCEDFSLGAETRGGGFFEPLRKTFRPKRETFYVILLILFRANDKAGDLGQNGAE